MKTKIKRLICKIFGHKTKRINGHWTTSFSHQYFVPTYFVPTYWVCTRCNEISFGRHNEN